jgi:hypothetical protein
MDGAFTLQIVAYFYPSTEIFLTCKSILRTADQELLQECAWLRQMVPLREIVQYGSLDAVIAHCNLTHSLAVIESGARAAIVHGRQDVLRYILLRRDNWGTIRMRSLVTGFNKRVGWVMRLLRGLGMDLDEAMWELDVEDPDRPLAPQFARILVECGVADTTLMAVARHRLALSADRPAWW